jgi:hypothetical protein
MGAIKSAYFGASGAKSSGYAVEKRLARNFKGWQRNDFWDRNGL